ncbi:MAG: hypothetical protein ABS96_05215 [Lysobacteraceae bacterium SCN 69-123]|uniref:CC0125/CC1285 family lipoprotein n=1 Tax=Stenotrophomonas acidaminiphila TaxID=128780 RepID=UPI00086E5345|nr:hypothetical protein [Stenotrophomonas acidaminiphila]MBN8802047.1 hypothetical protein [Stenotrophomonas acidaminiphila]MDF9443040.1 hypothetical protein [Stenotrophomonas acidaminiphila]ODU47452.1 MAG: hypothetical protein ABS96_05215 [Xanthomonadaceae bacterium SCN 69-123]OJY80124.1 MAG: hypothetical protein BGP18_14450 [Stenotrophomonas sp. 69-14]
MKRHLLGAAAMAMLLSACATGYHSASNPVLGLTGGYWDQPGPGRLIKVGFAGNGFITPDKVATYLLYRCAEVTQREGGSHFVFYTSLPDAISDRRSTERIVNSLGGKPATYAYILVLADAETDALSATEIVTRLGPLVKPAPKQGGAS